MGIALGMALNERHDEHDGEEESVGRRRAGAEVVLTLRTKGKTEEERANEAEFMRLSGKRHVARRDGIFGCPEAERGRASGGIRYQQRIRSKRFLILIF